MMSQRKFLHAGALALLCGSGGAPLAQVPASSPDAATERELGTLTITGNRPTSLPTQIPTTIEGISGEEIARKVNATDAEDALKYFPSLLVRKRYIGDYDHAVLATRASGTGNSARSLVFADGILLSNLLGNGATYTPRWGMVTPEEIERVDVLYGPFSAAYSGNSVGAVVDYVTRMPDKLEMHARVATFGEQFTLYGTDDRYAGWQASASVGDRNGDWAWWLNYNRLDNDSHPITFANRLLSAGTVASTGTAVTGALADRNPRNQDWLILGAQNVISTVQQHAKAKLAYDITPTARVAYTLGLWDNSANRTSESYLRDATGNAIYSGNINVDGRRYSLSAADFPLSRGELTHLMQGLSLKTNTRGTWDWEIAASLYDYDKDLVRTANVPIPAANTGGAGLITDQHGTNWNTLSLRGTWRSGAGTGAGAGADAGAGAGAGAAHVVDFGFERDGYQLRTLVSNTDDWIAGVATTRVSAFRGDTTLQGLYAQDTWRLAPDWRATLGLRFEQWQASDGAIASGTRTLSFADRSEQYFSPKAAIAWQVTAAWAVKASVGRAVRVPTVAELYQGSIANDIIVNNDPTLRPEKSWTGELTAERELGAGRLRATVFHEDTRDALYSQTNVNTTPAVTNIQNIQHIRTNGLELAGDIKELLQGLDLTASLTWARSLIVRNDNFPASLDKQQPRVPKLRANALASYRLPEHWNFTLGARYSGRQYGQLDNSDPNGFTYTGTSSFFVVDARARYSFAQRWVASLGVDNLNNAEYWNFHPYNKRTYMAEVNVNF